MSSRTLILEGPDGGGKTTLANHLRDKYGYQICKTNQPAPGEDLFISYTRSLLKATTSWRPTVFDRHYLGESVYGPVMRGEDRLGEMGRTLIERLCAARGVRVALVMPTWKQLVANWKAKNGADYLKSEGQLNQVHNAYFEEFDRLVDREFLGMYRYDIGLPDAGIPGLFEPIHALPPWMTGYPTARVLVVGEEVNSAAVPWDLPFHDTKGCSPYLYERVKALKVAEPDLAWANSRGRDGVANSLAECVDVMPSLARVVSLGKEAAEVCRHEFGISTIEVREIPHPQYWKRFKKGRELEYQLLLGEAMGL